MKLNMKTQGVAGIMKMFEKYGQEGKVLLNEVTAANAEQMAKTAKSKAAAQKLWDTGNLVRNISFAEVEPLRYSIFAGMHYSAYHEFGTGTLKEIPPGLEELASEFMGSGDRNFNIPARPFLYPAVVEHLPRYVKDIEYTLKHLNKKYGS